MKQIILNVLDGMTKNQTNLDSEAARKVIADSITVALESNGVYKQHTVIELERQEAKKEWVCQTCGKSTYETDYDYLVHPKLHLGCALEEELKGKDIKEQYHEASKSHFKDKNKPSSTDLMFWKIEADSPHNDGWIQKRYQDKIDKYELTKGDTNSNED
tara:strand:+ start:493 stop:969 length:477 start_codon:yes stop_codon:yes gene_type:complete